MRKTFFATSYHMGRTVGQAAVQVAKQFKQTDNNKERKNVPSKESFNGSFGKPGFSPRILRQNARCAYLTVLYITTHGLCIDYVFIRILSVSVARKCGSLKHVIGNNTI